MFCGHTTVCNMSHVVCKQQTIVAVQEHLQSLSKMKLLVDSVLGHSSHPHAIDGSKFKGEAPAAANLQMEMSSEAGSADLQSAACKVDILQLLQASRQSVWACQAVSAIHMA